MEKQNLLVISDAIIERISKNDELKEIDVFAWNVMEEKFNTDDVDKALKHLEAQKLIEYNQFTNVISLSFEGEKFFLEGGYIGKIKETKQKENLYKIGQISLVIAGIYYFLEIVKIFVKVFANCNC